MARKSQPDTSQKQSQPSSSQPPESSGYWTGAHTKHRLRFHLVWIPKYRKRVLQGALAERLHALLQEGCEINEWQLHEINEWQLHEINIQPDHVHLLVQLFPTDSLPEVVQRLKGGTSRVLRLEFPELHEFLWGEHFWATGYFAETVGQVEEAALRRYIQQQREPAVRKNKNR
ncbi:MAG: IS200/IS605 family transposase [Janthinobacterium lividum]